MGRLNLIRREYAKLNTLTGDVPTLPVKGIEMGSMPPFAQAFVPVIV